MITKTTRHSKQRDAVLQLLQSVKTHPTAETLYSQLKNDYPKISLATVYRNLKLLQSKGKIISFYIDAIEHYDGCCKEHYHFVCNCCKNVIDIPANDEDIMSVISKYDNLTVDNYSLIFYGLCDKCKKE